MVFQAYQAPKINQVAPNKRGNRWDEIGGVEAPFPGNPDPDQFGFWFNYFWAEARVKPDLTPLEKSKLTDMFFSVLTGTAPNFAPIPGLAAKEDSFKENVLRQILLIGFKRVALEPPRTVAYKSAGGRVVAPPPLMAVNASTLNWEHSVIIFQSHDRNGLFGRLYIGFRSDTRSYDDLVKSKGFNARARQDGWVYTCYAFNQRWNPFNNPVYSDSLFLRLGAKNRDACLQTVVSTGANFRDVVHFPILNDYGNNFTARDAQGVPLAVKPAELWTELDIQLAAADRMKVRAVKGTGDGVDHVEKDNHIHVFHTEGLRGFNTADHFGGVDKFPERSMEGVPLANLLADVHFVQKWWYNPDEGQIVFYDVEFSPIRWVPSEQAVENLLGEIGKNELKHVIEREIAAAKSRAQDIVPNNAAYKQYQLVKATLLTAQEKQKVYAALKDYIGPLRNPQGRYSPNARLEKQHVLSGELSGLASKINAVQPAQWSQIRTEAMRLAGWT